MGALDTTSLQIPNDIAEGIFKKAQTQSVLSRLSGSKPQKFGTQTAWILTGAPKAELVGEAVAKSPTPTTYAPKTISPLKMQVTMRFSNELEWADEDAQIGILQDLAENAGIALGRALDLAAIHKINPLTGTVSTLVKEGLVEVTHSAIVADNKYDKAIEACAGIVIDAGYTPTGIAMDTALSFGLSTMRDGIDHKIYPEIGFGQNISNFEGMNAAVGDTVSAKNELATPSDILGIVGQFDAFRWGVQRSIGAHLIEFGDPDGLGDLQRMNQLALRAEIVYGIGIMDMDAFALVKKGD